MQGALARPGRGRAVRLRAQRGALADGGGAAASRCSVPGLRGVGRRAQGASSTPSPSPSWRNSASTSPRIGRSRSRSLRISRLNFDLIVTLSPEAHHRALELTRTAAVDVEYWPTADPTVHGRQPRAAARRLPRGARPADGAHPRPHDFAERRQRVNRAASSVCSLPLVGEGWGGGVVRGVVIARELVTPTPNPSPQAERGVRPNSAALLCIKLIEARAAIGSMRWLSSVGDSARFRSKFAGARQDRAVHR